MALNSQTEWPAELDAVVAAPQYHVIVLENDAVRVLDTRIPAGHLVPLHTHRWPCVQHVIAWSAVVRRGPSGEVLQDRVGLPAPTPGMIRWLGPNPPHTVENLGPGDVHLISIEIKG